MEFKNTTDKSHIGPISLKFKLGYPESPVVAIILEYYNLIYAKKIWRVEQCILLLHVEYVKYSAHFFDLLITDMQLK